MKKCNKCQKELSLDLFEKSSNCKDGYRNTCKKCRGLQKKIHYNKCENCGVTFKTSKTSTKFCSMKCSGIYKRKRVSTKCAYCDSDIEIIKSKYGKHEYYYCNQDCRTKHLKKLMVGENNSNYNSVKYECDGCGTTIKTNLYKVKNQNHIFCSNECYKLNIGKFCKGENNNNWNHKLTKSERLNKRRYPAYYEWRKNVYDRDNYTCQCCGNKKSGNLIAHHIMNYSSNEKLRVDINNGITLCVDCHKKFHNKFGYFNNNKKQLEQFIKETRAS